MMGLWTNPFSDGLAKNNSQTEFQSEYIESARDKQGIDVRCSLQQDEWSQLFQFLLPDAFDIGKFFNGGEHPVDVAIFDDTVSELRSDAG